MQHCERLDGSGYPRGLSGAAITRPARILGAADAYQAMREPRPYRPARAPDDAASELMPLNIRIAHGCHCNRPTLDGIRAAGFGVTQLGRDALKHTPPLVRPLIVGIAEIG